ncbi:MAG TPA: hypothetical protein VEW46_12145 [Pyrinomonadaceae bacterium]|nr:hypothetical protein [Pyrinomonadaceae bacterium]
MKAKLTLCLILLFLTVASGVRKAETRAATAMVPCWVGREAPPTGFWTWAAGAHVKVYIRSGDFKPEQTRYLLTALQNWNSALELTGSGVHLEYQGFTKLQLSCENCLTIMRGAVFDKTRRHATELRAFSLRHDRIISYAAIVVDPRLTNAKALIDAVAHELGHNFGLFDCYSCRSKSTIMNQFKAMNVPNDVPGPTRCDVAQVTAVYRELKMRLNSASTKQNLIDEGEEPLDDDTPIVLPKP